MKSCSNCQKKHRNRVTDLCNDCRPKKEYPLCKCGFHHIYHGTSCRTCFKKDLGLSKYSFNFF